MANATRIEHRPTPTRIERKLQAEGYKIDDLGVSGDIAQEMGILIYDKRTRTHILTPEGAEQLRAEMIKRYGI